MRFREFNEAREDSLEELKKALLLKIKELPLDSETVKTLEEIEDLLDSVQAGGRVGVINNRIEEIGDPEVTKARKILAKYILSVSAEKKYRDDFFNKWKNDQLVNIKKLTSPINHVITDIINGYNENPFIKEITDDLAEIAALGQGKGEFLLSVFSKSINKMGKGDLNINGMSVELKTVDGGAGRFFDQEVRPTMDWYKDVELFLKTFSDEIHNIKGVAKSGIKIDLVSNLYTITSNEKKADFQKILTSVIKGLFSTQDVNDIVKAILSNNIPMAKQLYAKKSIDHYLSIKQDDALLMIDLRKSPTEFTFFKSVDDLYKGGMRLHAGTIYPITQDPRYAYPQISIARTKQTQP